MTLGYQSGGDFCNVTGRRKRVDFLRPDGSRGDFTGSCDSCIVIWDGHLAHWRKTIMVGWEQAA